MTGDVRADIGAERGILGAILAGASPDPVAHTLTPDHFWQPRHADIWAAMLRVRDEGQPCEIGPVGQALTKAGSTIDPLYLVELHAEAPLSVTPDWYAARLIEEAGFRALVAAGTRIIQAAQSQGADLDDTRDVARAAVDAATAAESAATTHVRVGAVMPEVIDIADGKTQPALPTPWPDLNRTLTGLAPGRLTIVGARPNVGKSLMGTNLALHFADHHAHAVLIASMEMGRVEVTQRLVSAAARVDLTRLTDGKLTPEEWQLVSDHHARITDLPISIADAPSQSVAHVRSAAREVMKVRPDLALIVVDYLQLMRAPEAGPRANRAEVLGEVSRGLKLLARETGAAVVAMAQVNREAARRGDRPKMSDLRESGSIEADADQVILLHRPDDMLPEVEVVVDKNRWGPKGEAVLHIQGNYARFTSAAWSPSGALR